MSIQDYLYSLQKQTSSKPERADRWYHLGLVHAFLRENTDLYASIKEQVFEHYGINNVTAPHEAATRTAAAQVASPAKSAAAATMPSPTVSPSRGAVST